MATNDGNTKKECYKHSPPAGKTKYKTSIYADTDAEKLKNVVAYVVDQINDVAGSPLLVALDNTVNKTAPEAGETTLDFTQIIDIMKRRLDGFTTSDGKKHEALDKNYATGLKLAVAQYIDARICHAMLSDFKNAQECIDEDATQFIKVYLMVEIFMDHLIQLAKLVPTETEELKQLLKMKETHLKNIAMICVNYTEPGDLNETDKEQHENIKQELAAQA